MSMMWLATSFNYYLIGYLLNTFEEVYLSATLSSLSELAAYGIAGVLYKKLGLKLTISMSFAIAVIGGVLIIFVGLDN